MNEVLRVIKERRSMRKFKEEQLKDSEMEQIIEAGLFAPSGHNKQTWNFTVVQNKEILDELSVAAKEVCKTFPDEYIQKLANNEKFHVFYDAPTVVIVSGKDNEFTMKEDCSAATQNMLLAAESLNIGSCWVEFVGILFSSEKGAEYKSKLNIPEGYSPLHAVALGYKGVELTNAPARKENAVQYIK